MSDDATVAMHPAATVVRRSITIETGQQHAFDVFTDGIATWWPPEHHLGDTPLTGIVIEPKVGGRCYTTEESGREIDWASVLVWEPPSRIVIGWHITADWVCDPNFVTEVDVTFTAQGPGKTLVSLEHRNLDRYGAKQDEMFAALDSDGGWPGSLRRFAASAEGRNVAEASTVGEASTVAEASTVEGA